jgi:16S rRNA (adenine1518-N6/adenine1519-N6)-dimethyltransferase
MNITKPKQENRIQAKKSLGQNFLTDQKKAQSIAALLQATQQDSILEIGAGCGDLTRFLLQTPASHLHAIELDERAISILTQEFGGNSRFTVQHGDFLQFPLHQYAADISNQGKTLKIAGNIPYYITSDILFHIFAASHAVECAVIMMQKEVAQRICASPRTKEYGILSVAARLISKPRIALHVPAGCFTPRPSIDSAVVHFDFKNGLTTTEQYLAVHPFVRMAFQQRRKMLSNAIKSQLPANIPSDSPLHAFLQRRAEELEPLEFIQLRDAIKNS